jgi:hypothetical protein
MSMGVPKLLQALVVLGLPLGSPSFFCALTARSGGSWGWGDEQECVVRVGASHKPVFPDANAAL